MQKFKEAILPGQKPADRFDLISRVFYCKVQQFIHDITKNKILAEVVAYIYTIEFQKRNLPHTHCVVTLHPDNKLRTPEDVDSLISAEFPDEHLQPELYALVKKHMVHGPCGQFNSKAQCMDEKTGKCTKGFPKPFRDHTTLSDDSYAAYRCRNDNRVHEVHGCEVDNPWIVPYSPYFLWKYQCHFNVECVISFKYIHKYIYKGHNHTTMEFGKCQDEVKQYLDAQYIDAHEACWRLFMFNMHAEVPAVVRLQVHLPNGHYVVWNSDIQNTAQDALERVEHKKTTLMAFFKANEEYEEAHNLLYHEFPQFFVWLESSKKWKLRQRGMAIGRMHYIPPTAGERFYLRTLLTAVRGPQSFEELRTFEGTIYPTFHDACVARGLLEDDGEWNQCLEDASTMQTGKQLRSLFAVILRDCCPTQPVQLWEKFRNHICDDLKYALQRLGKQNPTEEEIYDYGLYLINQLLQYSNKSLSDYPSMPLSQMDWHQIVGNRLIVEQQDYNREEQQRLADQYISMLNADQHQAFDKIMDAVDIKSGECFFINGPGGTGKTFVYNVLCYVLRAKGKIVICVASSGIAAILLIGGRTSHLHFKIPIIIHESSTCSIRKNSLEAALFQAADIVIWDEVPMQHRHIPEAVDRTLRDIRNCDKPFGGLSVVFGGDFQQILPVIVKGSRLQIVGACL